MLIPWSNSEGYPRPRFFLAPRLPLAGICNIPPQVGRCLGTDLRKFLHIVSFRFLYSTEQQEMQLSLTAHWQCWVHSWGAASSYLPAYCLTQPQPGATGWQHARNWQAIGHSSSTCIKFVFLLYCQLFPNTTSTIFPNIAFYWNYYQIILFHIASVSYF